MKTVFEYTDYRSFFQHWVIAKSTEQKGLLGKLSNHLGCQNSQISRVLKDEVHLTPDQAYLFSDFAKMSDRESQYFKKIVEYGRASHPKFKVKLHSEIELLRAEFHDISKHVHSQQIKNAEFEMTYYSHWIWIAIHMLTDIKRFQTASAIAEKLKLDEKQVRESLEELHRVGLVNHKNDLWTFSGRSIHLPKTSPMSAVNHQSWRSRAVEESKRKFSKGIHYTVVQSISKNDVQKLKFLFLELLNQYHAIAGPSLAEELICFNLDFFEL